VHLEGLRLAQRLSPTSWRLAEGWQQPLREPAARGDILKQIHAAISGDPARYLLVANQIRAKLTRQSVTVAQ